MTGESSYTSIEIIIKAGEQMNLKKRIICPANINILKYLQLQKIIISSPCGGNGTCGKCKIRLIAGNLMPSETDRKFFKEEELKSGYRLACTAVPRQNVLIEYKMPSDEADVISMDITEEVPDLTHRFGIAIDIGTTTIAVALADIDDEKVIYADGITNHQNIYGADVVSRVVAANSGHLKELQGIIKKDILEIVERICKKYGGISEKICDIVISANTTMQHFLQGYSCEGLGSFPFNPISLGGETYEFNLLFENTKDILPNAKVRILKGISTYVGADITSGIMAYDIVNKNETALFIDLGTNGEMAVINNGRITVASTAAGPALEGGNLSCGVGSIGGAICGVKYDNNEFIYQTINDLEPAGICGTGVIELISVLLENGIINNTGNLSEEYFERGFEINTLKGIKLVLTMGDIREFQLAKGAIRAGIDTLLKRAGLKYLDIDKVYISGGLGTRLKPQAAGAVGLIPGELIDSAISIGNSSLQGAVLSLYNPQECNDKIEQIIGISQEDFLGNDEEFRNNFIESMNF